MALAGKQLILGVTGSIAAYKAVELLRALTTAGAAVQVVLLDPDGGVEALPLLPKRQVAQRILDRVVALRQQQHRGEDAGNAKEAPRSLGL